ncbi:MAG: MFS transporter [Clostridiales bacterium]|nr:MFS transporter [Clostridiales bacterium]
MSSGTKRIITVCACILLQMCVGILYLWSLFLKPTVDYFSWNLSSAKYVSSIMIFGFTAGNLFGGIIRDKIGSRITALIGAILFALGIFFSSFLTKSSVWVIYITYSAISGLGCGFAYAAVLVCLQKWFPTRRGFASGIAVASFGISTVIFTPVIEAFLKVFTVVETFRYLSMIFIGVGVLASLFIFSAEESGKQLDGSSLSPKQAIKLPSFWCIFLSLFFINAAWNIAQPIIKDLGIKQGLDSTVAGILVATVGVGSALGRFSMASLSDKLGRANTVIGLAVLTALCSIALIWAGGYFYFVVIVFTAFAYGGPSAIFPPMTTDLCGPKYAGTNYGIAMLGLGFSAICFTSISNALYESSGAYTYSFIVAAVSAIIPIGLMLLCKFFESKRKNKTETE